MIDALISDSLKALITEMNNKRLKKEDIINIISHNGEYVVFYSKKVN